jgi:hypothetical protein
MLKIDINLVDNYSIVPDKLFLSEIISNEELVLYCLLQRNYSTMKSFGIYSIEMICDFMYVSYTNSRIIKTIRDSIQGLINKDYIAIRDKNFNEVSFNKINNKTHFYVGFDLPQNAFYKVYDSALDNLFETLTKSKISKFGIARYYIACMRVISNQATFGYISQSGCKKCGFASDTCSKYLKMLQDLGLILYNNDYLTQEKHYTKTFIGMAEDDENFKHQLKFESDRLNLIHTDKKTSNKRRSVSKKIDNTKKKIDTAKDDEIAKLKEMLAKAEAEKKELEFKVNEKKSTIKKKGLNKPETIIEEVQPIEEDWGSEENISDEDITQAIDNAILDMDDEEDKTVTIKTKIHKKNEDIDEILNRKPAKPKDEDCDIFGNYVEHEKMQEQKEKNNDSNKNKILHEMFGYPLNPSIPEDDDGLDF